ncbi:MAG: hypothetical protein M9939_26680 [Mesorhizobium sp.]|nr:hypothetical protein [Mesorhizobium sp.]MCO5085143.1 hypothetical protein [Rhizobiaceae bacterium]MCO5164680.1 hypothetical protein [Mesorhizobium sp.]
MTDDQFRELRQLILNLAIRVEAIELHLKRQDELSEHRFGLIYEWCAPASYKAKVDSVEIDVPDDLRRFLPDQN